MAAPKITFGTKHWNAPTPAKVKKIGTRISAFLASLAVLSIIQDHPYWSAGILAAAGFINEIIIPLFGEEETEAKPNDTK